MRIKQQFILAAFLAAYLPFAQADQEPNLANKIEQAKLLLNQIQNEARQNNQSRVYLGTAQVDAYTPIDLLDSYTNQLIALLNTFQNNKKQAAASDLQWLPSSAKGILFNAGQPGEDINICRAAFIGANVQSKAIYPGQLTSSGCRISYAGYAFIVTKFDVLAGKNDRLQWISIADVKKSTNELPKSNTNIRSIRDSSIPPAPSNEIRFGMPFVVWPSQLTFNFNIKINGALPIAGGYEGGRPVLICRAHQNNASVIGKLVFFINSNGQKQDICDIGVDDKEVVIENNFELLFWKQETGTNQT